MAIPRNSNTDDQAGPSRGGSDPPRDGDRVHASVHLRAEARRNLTRFVILFIVIESLSNNQFDPRMNLRLLSNVYRIPDSNISAIDHMVSSLISELREDQRHIVMAATIIHSLYFAIDDDE